MSASTSQKILMYDVEKEGRLWFIYWLDDENILGMTDFGRQMYTLQLDKCERKQFMNNMAETLLVRQWQKIFNEKKFKIVKFDHESAQLMYAPNKELELPRVEEEDERINAIQKFILTFIKVKQSLPNENSNETVQIKRPATDEENGLPEKKPQMQSVQRIKTRRVPGRVQQGPITFDDVPIPDNEPEEQSNSLMENGLLQKTNQDQTETSEIKETVPDVPNGLPEKKQQVQKTMPRPRTRRNPGRIQQGPVTFED